MVCLHFFEMFLLQQLESLRVFFLKMTSDYLLSLVIYAHEMTFPRETFVYQQEPA